MHQIDYVVGQVAIVPNSALQIQHNGTAEFSDTCCWEQILKILEENGFGKRRNASAEKQTVSEL